MPILPPCATAMEGVKACVSFTGFTCAGGDQLAPRLIDREKAMPSRAPLPGQAGVGRAREPGGGGAIGVVLDAESRHAIPDRVDESGVLGVGGDALLVEGEIRVGVGHERLRRAPGAAAVGGSARQHRLVRVLPGVESEGDLVCGAVERNRHPWIAPTLVRAAGAAGEWDLAV